MTGQKTYFGLIMMAMLSVGSVATVSFMTPSVAQAQNRTSSAKAIVDQAIADGIVGETAAGYLALVKGSADAKITKAMNEVNIGRKTLYTNKAREEGVPVEQVAAQLGYADTSNFSRTFRRWFEMTPRDMRQSADSGVSVND